MMMLPSFQRTLQTLGSIQSLNFKGVGKDGWDEYSVKYAHGDKVWRVALDDKGVIVGAIVDAGS
jgi:hypothetical protein